MSRRTVTIDPALDKIINFVRAFFLMAGTEYNYTEVVNNAIFYGICYWLNIPHEKAVKIAPPLCVNDLNVNSIIPSYFLRFNSSLLI